MLLFFKDHKVKQVKLKVTLNEISQWMPVRRWTNLTMGTRAWVMGVTRAQWEIVLQTEAIDQLPHLFSQLKNRVRSNQKQCRGSESSHASCKQ
jgi:hypothetical protein